MKRNDSSMRLHLNISCKSRHMNGASHSPEVLTSTDVRKHQLPVCGPKLFTVLFVSFQMIILHQMHKLNRSLYIPYLHRILVILITCFYEVWSVQNYINQMLFCK